MGLGLRVKAVALSCLAVAVISVPVANGAVYVVDQNNPAAADTNPGTPEAPWKTIGKAAATVTAGDKVFVMEGTYDETVVLPSTAAGQPDKKTVFLGPLRLSTSTVGPIRQPATVKGFDLNGVPNVRIEGFRIVGGRVENMGDGDEIVGNYFQDSTSAVGAVGPGNSPVQPKGVYVGYNQMYHVQKGLWFYGSDWLAEGNEVERLKNWGTGDADYSRLFGEGHVIRCNYFHGARLSETGLAHTDGFQTFHSAGREGEVARRILIEDNIFIESGQSFIARSAGEGTTYLADITFRRNIFGYGYVGTWDGVAWGLCLENVSNFVVENNLIVGIMYHGMGLTRDGSAVVRNNIFHKTGYWSTGAAKIEAAHNIVFKYVPDSAVRDPNALTSTTDINADPLFVNLEARDWRLSPNSPAIDAGEGKVDIGPLAYPNVYYVDCRHPASTNQGYGYPAIPFKTISRALEVAQPGETIVVRGGVYRELVKPTKADVTIRGMVGEKVVVSGADEVLGWTRREEGWVAAVAAKPTLVLMDGKPFEAYTFAPGRITVTGMDPRVHLFETVARPAAIDTQGMDVVIEGIETANVLPAGE